MLFQMAEHLDFLKNQRDNPKSWPHLSRMYKVLSDQIERSNITVSDVSTKLAEAHANYYTEGFLLGFNKVLEIMREREILEGDIEDDQILELVQSGIGESSEYLSKVTARETVDG